MRRGGLLGVVLIVLILFVALAVIAAALVMHGLENGEGFHFTPSKKVGTPHTLGEFNVTGVRLENVVGRVVVLGSNGSSLVVETNLPLEYRLNSTLTLYCPSKYGHNVCSDYEKGYVGIKAPHMESLRADHLVGNLVLNVELGSLTVKGVVGNVIVRNTSTMVVNDVTGNVRGSCGKGVVSKVIGNVEVGALEGLTVSDVVGNVKVILPENASLALKADGSFTSKLRIGEGVYEGSYELPVEIDNIVGNVVIEKGAFLITPEG